MSLEKELKFPCADFDLLKKYLLGANAVFEDSYFESNQVFDTPARELKHKDILLRLREANKNVFCLKRPPQEKQSAELKVWEELETEIQAPGQLRSILFALGFVTAFCYEKLREKWSLGACKVCLDLVPFGKYVEIEGEMEEITYCAGMLRLDMQKSSTKTYQQLNREYRAKHGLTDNDSFVFPEPLRSKLIEKGTHFCYSCSEDK